MKLMVWEIGVLLIGIACCVVVLALIPTLLEAKQTLAQSRQTLELINSELTPLIKEMRAATADFDLLMDNMQSGMEHASMLFHALGDLGDRLHETQQRAEALWQRAQSAFTSRGGSWLIRLASVSAGIAAVGKMVGTRKRFTTQRSSTNGQ